MSLKVTLVLRKDYLKGIFILNINIQFIKVANSNTQFFLKPLNSIYKSNYSFTKPCSFSNHFKEVFLLFNQPS